MSTTILFPTDYSQGSNEILKLATKLARSQHATLLIAHVTMLEKTPVGELFDEEPEPDPAEMERLKAVVPSDTNVPFEHRLLYGVPGDVEITRPGNAIVKLAKEEKVDTIVMGTHGRTGLSHTLMGSVAETVLHNAPCPVVAVKLPAGPVPAAEDPHRALAPGSIDALGRALLEQKFSLAIYLRDGHQQTHPGDEPLVEAVHRIADDHERNAGRITRLLSDHVGQVPHGNFPLEFTEHDETALDYLLPELIRHEQQMVARIQQQLGSAGLEAVARQLLGELLQTEKSHVERLTEVQKTL